MVCLFLTGLAFVYFLVLVLGAIGTLGFYIIAIWLFIKAVDYIANKLFPK